MLYNGPDERYITVADLKQGQKFYYEGNEYLKLPDHCECYGNRANAVCIKTGTMMWFNPDDWIDQATMELEKNV